MTTGAIIFAQNNSTIDYTKLAVFAARRLIQHLDIPVSIITDNRQWLETGYPDHPFEKVIEIPPQSFSQKRKFNDGGVASKVLDWKNLSRSRIYDLTPYDRTLVIDSDYIINSNILKSALENEYDFQIYRNNFDLSPGRDNSNFTRINEYSIPFYWATVFIFEKNDLMQAFFDLISYIKDNWNYFRILYNIDYDLFRNDFAFSIAIHIMNGKTNGGFAIELPGKMVYASDKDVLVSADGDKMKFLVEKTNHIGEYYVAKTSGLDVHVINKLSLSRFIDGGSGV